jgi:hypothetical protein
VDQPDQMQSRAMSRVDVFGNHRDDISGSECVQVERVLNRDLFRQTLSLPFALCPLTRLCS